MFLVGLTGGIAAGKSTVAACWSELGGIEIDADQLAREVVEPGTVGLQNIRDAFGEVVIAADGSLDRAKLAEVVFGDAVKRKQLESIVHPLVQQRARELMNALPQDSMVIYNVPLLVESDSQLPFDRVVTVEAPQSVQVERLIENRGMTEVAAKARIAAQASSAQRANASDFILNSNQDLKLLLKDATALWRTFQKEAASGTD